MKDREETAARRKEAAARQEKADVEARARRENADAEIKARQTKADAEADAHVERMVAIMRSIPSDIDRILQQTIGA
jgi:hypothetical protein